MDPGPQERVVLADFGLAKDLVTGSAYTRSGSTLGTASYMSPEQARGELRALSPASDVWSLGCVLYELLAGRKAFDAEHLAVVVAQIQESQAVPIQRLRPDVPVGVSRVIGACLAPSPGGRHADAAALAADLRRALAGEPVRARPPRRRISAPIAVGAGMLAVAAGLLWLGWPAPKPPPRPPASPAAGFDQAAAADAWALRGADPLRGAEHLRRLLALGDSPPGWQVRLGWLWLAARRPDAARQAWRAVPASSPDYGDAQAAQATAALLELDTAGIRRAATRVPATAHRAAKLAAALLAVCDADWEAVPRALRDVPGWQAALLRGYAWARPGGRPRDAVRELTGALESGLRIPWIYNNRGTARIEMEDYAGALADFHETLRLDPSLERVHLNLGAAYYGMERFQAAAAEFSRCIQHDPEWGDAYMRRGQARRRLRDLAGAHADLSRALALNPGDANARICLGFVLRDQHRLPEALQAFSDALEQEPEAVDARNGRAILRKLRGDLRGAIADYDYILARHPDRAQVWFNRAMACWNLPDPAAAESGFRQAIAVDSDYAAAYGNLGLLLKQQRRWREAADAFRRYLQLDPDHPRSKGFRAHLAECEAKLKR